MTPRPLWRWWLFSAAFELSHCFRWHWPVEVMAWCVLPEWLGRGNDCSGGTGEVPF